MDHMTAKVSCFARAYHHINHKQHIFDDVAAGKLLGKDYEEIAQNMSAGVQFFFPGFEGTKEEGLRRIVEKQLSPSVLARSAYCESRLAKARTHGCRQYVIFASGYDTFSVRNTDPALSVYELDLPEMIADKTERIRNAGMKSQAIYVPCDLANPVWKDKLLEAAYHTEQQAFGSLLGISYYLRKEEFQRLLTEIYAVMAAGSVICFDYPSTDESVETQTNQRLASGAGEQMQAMYSNTELQEMLQQCGFVMAEHMHDREITEQFFSAYNQCNPLHPMQAPAGVAYVLAMKKEG